LVVGLGVSDPEIVSRRAPLLDLSVLLELNPSVAPALRPVLLAFALTAPVVLEPLGLGFDGFDAYFVAVTDPLHVRIAGPPVLGDLMGTSRSRLPLAFCRLMQLGGALFVFGFALANALGLLVELVNLTNGRRRVSAAKS